jgi:signal transduction histidine kinase
MDVDKHKHSLSSWLFVGVLAALCAALGALQYRWIGEVGQADYERLRGGLQLGLQRLSREFNSEVSAACTALLPGPFWDANAETEGAYAIRYAKWRGSSHYNGMFRRIALAVPEGDSLSFRNLDLDKGTFGPGEWPAAWSGLKDRLTARLSGDAHHELPGSPFGSPVAEELTLIDLPRFARSEDGPPWGNRRREEQWLLLELDVDYVRAALLPGLLQRHLGGGEKLDYQVEITARDNPSNVIYQSDPNHSSRIEGHSDASVGLFEVQFDQFFRRLDGGRGRGSPPPGLPSTMIQNPNRGRWLLSVRHRAGSLDAVVEQARRRNLAVTTAVLLLMLAAAGALVRFTRRAQRLAELQMEFVAGVSHELRTPLSVIRTAAHNLGGGLISSVKQVQRYGSLIEQESEKLTGIVEQVLMFSNAKAGRVIGAKEVVGVDFLIDGTLDACARIVAESRCTLEKHVDPELAPVLGDPTALRHALQNLVSNAAKYGSEGGWIGITATSLAEGENTIVEIRVADHGPGIPKDELGHIFDTFYRGKRAVEDQIHGTGLGLSLVKRIIEAHAGTVTVQSELGKGTEFVVRIPAAPADQIDEFADSVSRR